MSGTAPPAAAAAAQPSAPPAFVSTSSGLLAGKVAIVTGSTLGIGKAIAKAFLQHGAFVLVNGRSSASVDKVLAEFAADGLTAAAGVVADVGNPAGCKEFFTQVDAVGREVDILVCNVGIFYAEDFFAHDDEQWETYFQVNVMSCVRMARHYLKPMLERNRGRVILVSSEAGVRPIPDMIPYCVTKASQICLARGLAELTKGSKVTVNSLLPGPTATEGVATYVDGLRERKA